MAWDAEAKAKMENAANEATAEFDAQVTTLKNGNVKLPAGQWIIDWMFRWYRSAGYKRLSRHMFTYTTPPEE